MAWFNANPSDIPDQLPILNRTTAWAYSTLNTKTDKIPPYVFYGSAISSVSSTDVVEVKEHAFDKCSGLGLINLPYCTDIGQYAFQCNRVSTQQDPVSVDIYLNSVQSIAANAFYNFGGTDDTAEIVLNNCTYIGNNAFAGTTSYPLTVKSFFLPVLTTLGQSAFQRVTAETIEIGNDNQDYTGVGTMATPLANATVTNFILHQTTPPTLSSSYGLGNNATITHIYVPSSAVNDYKTANRWSSYASSIEAIPSA